MKRKFYYPAKNTRTVDFQTIIDNPETNFNDEIINNWTTDDILEFEEYLKKTNNTKEYYPNWVFLKQQYREMYSDHQLYMNRIKIGNGLTGSLTLLVLNFAFLFSVWFLAGLIISAILFYYYNVVRKNRAMRTFNFVKRNLDNFDPINDVTVDLKF